MNEMLGPRPESPFSPDQTPQVRGYEYPPFSILHNPAIKQTHELFLSYTPLMDELSAARWLYSLTQFNSEGNLPFGNRFYSFPDNGPLSVPESQQIEPTVGLLIYTSSKLEHALRLQKVNTPEGTDNGISLMLSSELAQLSNAYRSRYRLQPDNAYFLDISQSLAMYALRFKEPDGHGYSQSLGHWLHLPVSVDVGHSDKLDHYEEVLRLSLALEEIGYGPENDYVRYLVEDLKKLYELKGESDRAAELENHYKNIPSIENEIEHARQKESNLNRQKRL